MSISIKTHCVVYEQCLFQLKPIVLCMNNVYFKKQLILIVFKEDL